MMSRSHSTNHYEGHKEFSMTRCLQRDLGGYDIIDEVIGLEKTLPRSIICSRVLRILNKAIKVNNLIL